VPKEGGRRDRPLRASAFQSIRHAVYVVLGTGLSPERLSRLAGYAEPRGGIGPNRNRLRPNTVRRHTSGGSPFDSSLIAGTIPVTKLPLCRADAPPA
jgi:hypothetical protein